MSMSTAIAAITETITGSLSHARSAAAAPPAIPIHIFALSTAKSEGKTSAAMAVYGIRRRNFSNRAGNL